MLNKADYIEMLSSYDRKMLDEYVAYAEYVALCREGLEEEKKVLDEAKIAVEEEEASLNELIADKEQEMYKMSSDIQSKEAAIREYEAEIAAQNDTIKALEAAVAEERKRLVEEQRRRYDGGVFTWPAPSYTRISDEYGNRTHPILGIQQFHNGLDMAAPGESDSGSLQRNSSCGHLQRQHGQLYHDRPWRQSIHDLYACIRPLCVERPGSYKRRKDSGSG